MDATTPRRALIIGASRGIGAGLVRHLLASGAEVHATVRSVASEGELDASHPELRLHQLDVRDQDSVDAVTAALGRDAIDLLIHNAGIYRGHTREELMAVNADAPIRMVETMLNARVLAPEAVVVLMTSQMGARRGSTGSLGDYGDSKAALNDAFRDRWLEWRESGIRPILVHPGWVRTDMGGPNASISVDESAAAVLALVAPLEPGMEGRFWTWDRREHPW